MKIETLAIEKLKEINNRLLKLNGEIEALGYEIQSISLNLGRINTALKEGKEDKQALLEKRRKVMDAMNKRINELLEKKEEKRKLVLERRNLREIIKKLEKSDGNSSGLRKGGF